MSAKAKRKAAVLAVTVMTVAMLLGMIGCTPKAETQYYSVDKDSLSIGIISDTQLTANYDNYAKNLEKSLEYLKQRDTDVLIFAGDYADLGTKKAA